MIEVVLGDLASEETEAIVRPIRSDLSPVSALSRDLGNMAGLEMADRLRKIGTLPVGGAVMTPGGALATDFLIHLAVTSDDEPQTSFTVRKALLNGLRRAADWALVSLALPPLGIGAGTLEADQSARSFLEILFDHLDEGRPPRAFRLVVTSEYEVDLFRRLVDELAAERTSG